MTTMTRYPLAFFLLALAACGDDPCLPTILADTSIIPAEQECDGSTGDPTTGGGDSTTGDICEAPPIDALICAAVPEAGTMWGPCDDGSCGVGAFCITSKTGGEVCAPACGECGCPNLGCFGGTCNDPGACLPACDAVGDPCPVPGMQCAPDVGACVWPKVDECVPAVGEAWGPCEPSGACADGLVCESSIDATADHCVPLCSWNGPACEADACADSPAVCQTSGICGDPCTGLTDCQDGQVCAAQPNGGFCMWPIQ